MYRVNAATGTEQVLHSFGRPADGAAPLRALLDVSGTLYGTTDLGGSSPSAAPSSASVPTVAANGSSTVFAIFRDGCNPFASLIYVKRTLYGTTCCGGGNYCSHCEGTLFSVDLATGTEQVLHKFGQGPDGSHL